MGGPTVEEILQDVLETLKEEGAELKAGADELRAYAAERATHLSTLVGQPGYAQAAAAERDAVALKAGILAVEAATGTDARWLGVIQGGLLVAARVLALGLA